MAAGEEILKQLAKQEIMLARLMSHLGLDRAPINGGNGNSATSNGIGAAGEVAPLAAIQGERGDPEIKGKPRDWIGQSFDGYRASQCPPDFLDVFADFLDWKADKPRAGKEQYAKYDRMNAARCRRWAVEIREGRIKQTPVEDRDAALPPPPAADGGSIGGNQWESSGDIPPPPSFEDDDAPF